MGIRKNFLGRFVFALLAASIIAKVHCLPKAKVDELREQEMERIRANILTRLGVTQPLGSSEPLTEDEEAVVAAFKDYQTAEEVKADMTTTKYTFVGQLRKQGTVIPHCCQVAWHLYRGYGWYFRRDVIFALSLSSEKLACEY